MTSPNFSGSTSTANAARALGVSVSTVKRWVDEGILPAQKTAGGHRKVSIADIVELSRRGDLPHADLSQLIGSPSETDERLADKLTRALLAGEADVSRALIVGAVRGGMTVADLADHAIAPAMSKIGDLWEAGRIDVMDEHLASQLCASALYEVKTLLADRPDREASRRPCAVGGSPEGDFSALPTLLVQICLSQEGWRAVNLGPNTPLSSFEIAIDTLRPRLVWLSVSHFLDSSFRDEYKKFYRRAESAGAAVAIGGRALSESLRQELPYTMHGDTMNHLAAFCRTLSPRPKRPTRGRPRGG